MLSSQALERREDEVRKLFSTVYNAKLKHYEWARKYRSSSASVIKEILREKYGRYFTYFYEPFDEPYKHFSHRLFLAYLIAERGLLFKERKLLKNITIAIVGMGGAGKTTYSVVGGIGGLYILSRIMPRLTEERIHEMSKNLILFEPHQLVYTVKTIVESRRWSPYLIFDDMGSQISKYWVFLGQHHLVYLFSVMDQVKDWSGVIIMTARRFESIPSRLREICDIVVDAREVTTDDGIVADVFEYYRYEDYIGSKSRRTRLKKLLYVDAIPPTLKMPDYIWKYMLTIRRETGMRRLELVYRGVQALSELEEQQLEKIIKKTQKQTGEQGDKNEQTTT